MENDVFVFQSSEPNLKNAPLSFALPGAPLFAFINDKIRVIGMHQKVFPPFLLEIQNGKMRGFPLRELLFKTGIPIQRVSKLVKDSNCPSDLKNIFKKH